MTTKKTISTCIERELWKQAQISNISWARALELGIEMLLGGGKKIVDLKEEKRTMEAKLIYINNEIERLENEDVTKKNFDEKITKHIDIIRKAAPLVMEDITRLKAWNRRWINSTGIKLSDDDFFQLCKKCNDGEFVEPKKSKCD